MSLNRFSSILKSELLEFSLLNHPFYQLWNKGLIEKDILKEYSRQYYLHVQNFPRSIAAIMSNCSDQKSRNVLLENLCDEEQDKLNGQINHITLWRNFCLGLGLTASELDNIQALDSTSNLINTFNSLSRKSYEDGLGMLYAQEHNYSNIAKDKRENLDKHYNINNKDTIKFFAVHEEADIIHAQQIETLLDQLQESSKETVKNAGVTTMKALNGFLDGIMNKYNLHELMDSVAC